MASPACLGPRVARKAAAEARVGARAGLSPGGSCGGGGGGSLLPHRARAEEERRSRWKDLEGGRVRGRHERDEAARGRRMQGDFHPRA